MPSRSAGVQGVLEEVPEQFQWQDHSSLKEDGEYVAPWRYDTWQLIQLQKIAPDECNHSYIFSLQAAWDKLDSKYATPIIVSSRTLERMQQGKLKTSSTK